MFGRIERCGIPNEFDGQSVNRNTTQTDTLLLELRKRWTMLSWVTFEESRQTLTHKTQPSCVVHIGGEQPVDGGQVNEPTEEKLGVLWICDPEPSVSSVQLVFVKLSIWVRSFCTDKLQKGSAPCRPLSTE